MFDWIKNKAFNLRWLDDSLEFLSHQGSDEEVARQAEKVAKYIWIGLLRIEREGMSPKFFTDLYRKWKDEAVSKYKLQSVEHIEFAAPYIAMQFFLGMHLSKKVPDASKVLAKILAYIQSNCKNEEVADYILTKFGFSLSTNASYDNQFNEGDTSPEVQPSNASSQDPSAGQLITNWRLLMSRYEAMGPTDQEIVKREIHAIYERTLIEHPKILSIKESLLIPILNSYHVEFQQLASVNKLQRLAGCILIIAYKSTIFCSAEVVENFKDIAFTLVLEGKDLAENDSLYRSSTNADDLKKKSDESLVVSAHPILIEYIDLCKKYNALSLTSKYEARLALRKVFETVFEAHGYVTFTRAFDEKQFFCIRKTIKENSVESELAQLMGEFLWSTLLCFRFGEILLNSLVVENFEETCLSIEDCSYEQFMLDPDVQNVKVPDGAYSFYDNATTTSDLDNAIICPFCQKCVRLLDRKKVVRCKFCNAEFDRYEIELNTKDISTAQIEEILYNRPKTKQVRRIDAHSDAVIDSVQANPRSQFEKAVRCFMCGFSFQVDVLDRQANCPTCNQQITIV